MENPYIWMNLKSVTLLGFVISRFSAISILSVMENLILSPIKNYGGCLEADAKKEANRLTRSSGARSSCRCLTILIIGWSKATGCLSIAMMIDPEVIGKDEPTSALDLSCVLRLKN